MTQALHLIAERLAATEMEINPKGFVNRETITRSLRKGSSGIEQSNDFFYSFIDENSKADPTDTASFGEGRDLAVSSPRQSGSNSAPNLYKHNAANSEAQQIV